MLILSKLLMNQYVERTTKFYLQNGIVLTVSLLFPKHQEHHYGILLEYLIF